MSIYGIRTDSSASSYYRFPNKQTLYSLLKEDPEIQSYDAKLGVLVDSVAQAFRKGVFTHKQLVHNVEGCVQFHFQYDKIQDEDRKKYIKILSDALIRCRNPGVRSRL